MRFSIANNASFFGATRRSMYTTGIGGIRFCLLFTFLLLLLLGGSVSLHAQGAGSVDLTFDPGTGPNSDVLAVAVQADGKVIIGGTFLRVNGVSRNHLARLNANGSVDTTFDPGNVVNNVVSAIALQPDGKIVVGGNFDRQRGGQRDFIVRLNADGSLDASFAGPGANDAVLALTLQPDGKIVLGGIFTTVNGVARRLTARLNPDGSVDQGFDPGIGAGNNVYSLAVQADGKVLIGGTFVTVNKATHNLVARLNVDGSLDAAFNPRVTGNAVVAIKVQPDGRILLGGNYLFFGGTNTVARIHFARVNADGTLDTSFDTGMSADNGGGSVADILVQPDGKIIAVGSFRTIQGVERACVARFDANGTVDQSFGPGFGTQTVVSVLARQSNGKIVVGGSFGEYSGVVRRFILQLNGDTAAGTATVSLAAGVTQTAPGAAPGTFVLTRTGDLSSNLTVFYKVGGTAVAGRHYQALSGKKKIKAGKASATLKVVALEDGVSEGKKTVKLQLLADPAYTAASTAKVKVKILD